MTRVSPGAAVGGKVIDGPAGSGTVPETDGEAFARWPQRLPQIMDFIGDDIVVAHNAAFDTSVIRYACDLDGTAYPDMHFMCPPVLARRVRQLPSYPLPFVLDSYGLTMGEHHNAVHDTDAAAILALAVATENRAVTLTDLAQQAGTSIGTMSADSYRGSGRVPLTVPTTRRR